MAFMLSNRLILPCFPIMISLFVYFSNSQLGDTYFNRAMMFNIGFKMANNLTGSYWDCFIFHDVDLLPEDDRNLYTCPEQPRHMSVGKWLQLSFNDVITLRNHISAIDVFKYNLPYKSLFGGVSAMKKVNIFNIYFVII